MRKSIIGINSSTGINVFLIPILFSIALNSCLSKREDDYKVQQIMITVNTPLLSSGGQLVNLPDTIPVLFFHNFEVYGIPYQHLQFVNRELESEVKKYRAFVRRAGGKYGLLFDSLQADLYSNGKAVLADSMLRQHAHKTDLAPLQDSMKMLPPLVSANSREEKYYFPYTIPEEYFDTVYLSYRKNLMDIRHSLSPKLDSSRNMKLYKAVFLFKDKTKKSNGVHLPDRRLVYEIVPVKKTPSPEMKSFIQAIEKDYQVILDRKTIK